MSWYVEGLGWLCRRWWRGGAEIGVPKVVDYVTSRFAFLPNSVANAHLCDGQAISYVEASSFSMPMESTPVESPTCFRWVMSMKWRYRLFQEAYCNQGWCRWVPCSWQSIDNSSMMLVWGYRVASKCWKFVSVCTVDVVLWLVNNKTN